MSGPAYQAAMISLEDKVHVSEIVHRTNEIKKYRSQFAIDGLSTYFILYQFCHVFPIQQEGKAFVKSMADKGVALRSWNYNNQNYCR